MSTHTLDVSGARALTSRTNDPASTWVSMPGKAGDDFTATLSGVRELRVPITANARVERRLYTRREIVRAENGVPVKADGEYVYEEVPVEELVLVLPGGATLFGRVSSTDEGAHEGTPHTQVSVKRMDEPHYLESGELVAEVPASELVIG